MSNLPASKPSSTNPAPAVFIDARHYWNAESWWESLATSQKDWISQQLCIPLDPKSYQPFTVELVTIYTLRDYFRKHREWPTEPISRQF